MVATGQLPGVAISVSVRVGPVIAVSPTGIARVSVAGVVSVAVVIVGLNLPAPIVPLVSGPVVAVPLTGIARVGVTGVVSVTVVIVGPHVAACRPMVAIIWRRGRMLIARRGSGRTALSGVAAVATVVSRLVPSRFTPVPALISAGRNAARFFSPSNLRATRSAAGRPMLVPAIIPLQIATRYLPVRLTRGRGYTLAADDHGAQLFKPRHNIRVRGGRLPPERRHLTSQHESCRSQHFPDHKLPPRRCADLPG